MVTDPIGYSAWCTIESQARLTFSFALAITFFVLGSRAKNSVSSWKYERLSLEHIEFSIRICRTLPSALAGYFARETEKAQRASPQRLRAARC